mgnify:CR=1 FL=1
MKFFKSNFIFCDFYSKTVHQKHVLAFKKYIYFDFISTIRDHFHFDTNLVFFDLFQWLLFLIFFNFRNLSLFCNRTAIGQKNSYFPDNGETTRWKSIMLSNIATIVSFQEIKKKTVKKQKNGTFVQNLAHNYF